MTSNAVPPSVTPPSPDEWPNTVRDITSITRNNVAKVTCPDHGFTTQDQGQTFVCFKQVRGMYQINGLDALIQEVIDDNNFTVNVNTTNFYDYLSNGVIIIDSGTPAVTTTGFQTYNTPFENIA